MNLALCLILALLCASVHTNNQVQISCSQCGSVACLTVSGGGFNGGSYPSSSSDCASAGSFPQTFNFQCGTGGCSDCQITVTQPGQIPGSICSQTSGGQLLISALNLLYSIQEGNTNLDSTYDWCGCSSGLSGGAIAGIVIGCVVGVALIGVAVWYFCVRKKSFDTYASKQ